MEGDLPMISKRRLGDVDKDDDDVPITLGG